MITLAESSGVATIGLVAVASAVRGMGIGTSLMRAAQRWMQDRGRTRPAWLPNSPTDLPVDSMSSQATFGFACNIIITFGYSDMLTSLSWSCCDRRNSCEFCTI